MDSGLCCLLVAVLLVGGLIYAHEESVKKKQQAAAVKPAAVIEPVPAAGPPALPDWPLRASLHDVELWIRRVNESARAAYQVGAPVPIGEVQQDLNRAWNIAQAITRKVHAVRASDGSDLRRLPRQTRDFLERDNRDLRRLSGTLEKLRDGLTNLIAGSGVDQSRKIRELENDVRALEQALQRFTR